MQKYIEINWLHDVDIIQCNALSPYISDTIAISIPIFILYKKYLRKYFIFIKNVLFQNNTLY